MKIAVCSDLHLEFGDLDLTNDESADVLILGGDIFIASELASGPVLTVTEKVQERADRYNAFITRCSERFPNVILIMGNHEHYHGDFAESAKTIRGTFGDLHNVHFLDKEWRIINGVLFFGGTLWTDMNGEDPITMSRMRLPPTRRIFGRAFSVRPKWPKRGRWRRSSISSLSTKVRTYVTTPVS